MNWASRPTTAVSTVVGPSHSTLTSRCTHCALFRGPSHPADLVKALAHSSPLADASALVAGMDQAAYRMSCRPARCGPSESSRVFAPSCRELRPPKSGGRVMFGRCQTCLDHRSEPISGANDER
jgi:hypothetical protein